MVGQRHAPAALPPGKRHGTHCTGCWVVPKGRSGRVRRISPPTEIRSLDRPALIESPYRLSYPGQSWYFVMSLKNEGKFASVEVRNTYRGSKGIAPLILNLDIRRRWAVTATEWEAVCTPLPVPTFESKQNVSFKHNDVTYVIILYYIIRATCFDSTWVIWHDFIVCIL
jgi:hypothetical protein